MHYMLTMLETAAAMSERDHPEKAEGYWGGWMAYAEAVRSSGVMVSGNGLQPPATATTLRIRNGQRHVEDGPATQCRAFARPHLARRRGCRGGWRDP